MIQRQERYDEKNTRHISLKLNIKTDADILNKLNGKPIQTEIKRLLRIGIKQDQK